MAAIWTLTHSHTMPPFDVSGKEAYSKHCGKRRKFSPFPTMFSSLFKTEIIIYVTFILSYANAFNLVKFLSSGNGLKVIS